MVYWTDCPLCGEGHPLFNGDEDGDIFFCKQENAFSVLNTILEFIFLHKHASFSCFKFWSVISQK